MFDESGLLAEQSLLCVILVHGKEALDEIRSKVAVEDFTNKTHALIYKAACALADDLEPVDPVTIKDKAAEIGHAIDPGYLRDLMLIPSALLSHVEYYVQGIINNTLRIKLKYALDEATIEATSGGDLRKIMSELRAKIVELTERSASGGIMTSMDAMLKFGEYRENLESGKAPAVVSSGYSDIDEILGGGFVSEGLYILAARPGVGKTTLALNIAERIAEKGNPILFVSLEMSLEQLSAKRVALETGISSTWLLNSNDKSHDRWGSIHEACRKLSESSLYFNKLKHASVMDVEKLATQISGLRLCIIDYLGLLRHTEGKTLYEKVTATSGALKRLARTLGIPIICLAQLNREVEGRSGSSEPRISDLRDSGAIEQDADGIILLHRHKDEDKENISGAPITLKTIIGKNRHGRQGSVNLDFYLRNGRIRQEM